MEASEAAAAGVEALVDSEAAVMQIESIQKKLLLANHLLPSLLVENHLSLWCF